MSILCARYVCVPYSCNVCGGQKGVSDPLDVKFKMVGPVICVWGTEPVLFARAANPLNHRAISPTPLRNDLKMWHKVTSPEFKPANPQDVNLIFNCGSSMKVMPSSELGYGTT